MASREITGAGPTELEKLEGQYYNTPKFQKHNIPFELAYCLNPIAKQPDHYDGPQRYCKRRAAKKDPEDYQGEPTGKAAHCVCCPAHGGHVTKQGHEQKHKLDNPLTAAITHGAYTDDEHLKMDFDEHEQELYDDIMENWPEIYDWPPRSEDPARYRILRRVAVNEVRAIREEDYLDNHEVHIKEIPTESGVQTEEVENPLSREYRLLMSEVTNQMKELGLTPKERQKMDKLDSEESANDAITEIASNALDSEDTDYDPERFAEDG